MSKGRASSSLEKKSKDEPPTPYDVMRMQNCKSFQVRQREVYPSIRPPVSSCNPAQTTYWLSKTMQEIGCDPVDQELVKNTKVNVENVKKIEKKATKSSCEYKSRRLDLPSSYNRVDLSRVKPYDVMRKHNCKFYKFNKNEAYPSIRPPISRCCRAHTAQWLAEAVDQTGCRYFDMEQDDVLEAWKQCPNKNTLGFYGVNAQEYSPEAMFFNKIISESLDKANGQRKIQMPKLSKIPEPEPLLLEPQNYTKDLCSGLTLNSDLLQSKICDMPTVRKKLDAGNTLSWLHCPRDMKSGSPFIETEKPGTLKAALDMEKPAEKPKQRRRRKYRYCDTTCNLPQNECTEYEWYKYQENPKKVNKLPSDSEEEKTKLLEPKNYEELYKQLLSCFENETQLDDLCQLYNICCRKVKKENIEDSDGNGDGGDTVEDPGDRRKPVPPIRKLKPKPPNKIQPEDPKESIDVGHSDKPDNDNKLTIDKTEKTQDKQKESVDKEEKKPSTTEKKPPTTKKKPPTTEKKPPTKDKKPPTKENKKSADKVDESTDSNCSQNKKISEFPPVTESPQEQKPHKSKKPKPPKPKDCPCDVCEYMNERNKERNNPCMRQLIREERCREQRDYCKQMRHREYLKTRKPIYPAPQHKCDPIVCDNFFCCNPKLGEYCDCLNAMKDLQELLGPKHVIENNELIFDVKNLNSRLCKKFCEYL